MYYSHLKRIFANYEALYTILNFIIYKLVERILFHVINFIYKSKAIRIIIARIYMTVNYATHSTKLC